MPPHGTSIVRGRFLGMQYKFAPPLRLAPDIVVFTLDDAAAFVRSYQGSRRPAMQDSVLRRLERADSDREQKDAADAFRGWAETEGVLVKAGL
jgi:hypothetical protein